MKWIYLVITSALLQSSIASASNAPLPQPDEKSSVKNFSKVIGWPAGKMPSAPLNFTVSKFADGLQSPRWMYVLPNGDVLVAEAKTEEKNPIKKIGAVVTGAAKSGNGGTPGNRITLFRDMNGDGIYELREFFLIDQKQPFGMLALGDSFYVANADSLWKYPYKVGDTKITGKGQKILDLPNDGRHWTKNIIANATGSKIYIAIGSASDHAEDGIEKEKRRANILEINPNGSGERIFASGIRNPVGMGWSNGKLWTAVNERDELGNDLVPDYLTEVKDGGFYGWPYSYWGSHPDPRLKGARPDLIKLAIEPNVSLGAHTASLGLAFYDKKTFPEKYHNGAFIGQHGSWNRAVLSGYKIAFVPFKDGKPSGEPEDFLVGFVSNLKKSEVYGRPVGVTTLPDGSILVADDVSNVIWKVTYTGNKKNKERFMSKAEIEAIPKGYHVVTPYIIVDDPAKALNFYEKALGAKTLYTMELDPGEIVHAEIKVGDSIIMLAGNTPEMHLKPQTGQYRSVSFMVYVPNVDEAAQKALEAGMKMIQEVRNQFYGDRTGTFEDPFGHVWTLATHIEDVTPAEAKKRAEKIYS